MSDQLVRDLIVGYSKRVQKEEVTPSGTLVRWYELEVNWEGIAKSILERDERKSRAREQAARLEREEGAWVEARHIKEMYDSGSTSNVVYGYLVVRENELRERLAALRAGEPKGEPK